MSQRVRVKICGINTAEAFDAAATAGADWVGFVFYPPSPRFVTPAQAAAIIARRVAGPLRVGLFVDAPDDQIEATLAAAPLDVLQMYCDAARVRAIRARFGVPVWRAVGVTSPDDLPATLDGADALVIEPKPPQGATRPGGNASAFDWELTARWTPPGPWLLAGGLTADNVREALAVSRANAIDVSSGVELAPGSKDPALVRRFVESARGT